MNFITSPSLKYGFWLYLWCLQRFLRHFNLFALKLLFYFCLHNTNLMIKIKHMIMDNKHIKYHKVVKCVKSLSLKCVGFFVLFLALILWIINEQSEMHNCFFLLIMVNSRIFNNINFPFMSYLHFLWHYEIFIIAYEIFIKFWPFIKMSCMRSWTMAFS